MKLYNGPCNSEWEFAGADSGLESGWYWQESGNAVERLNLLVL